MPEHVIIDTSSLVALSKINQLDVLCKIYNKIILPEAVIEEFGHPDIECFLIKKVENPITRLLIHDLNLGKGEAEVLALANETNMKTIIDDLKARKVAKTLRLNFTGTIGVLLKAEKLGLIESSYKSAKDLKNKGFYVSDELLNDIFKFKKFNTDQ